jgi:hypothetical protein
MATTRRIVRAVRPPHQNDNRSGLDFKNEGNEFFQKRDFVKAVRCYTQGIDVVAKSNVMDDELHATLLSNRSGCYYEMGNYGVSMILYECSRLT